MQKIHFLECSFHKKLNDNNTTFGSYLKENENTDRVMALLSQIREKEIPELYSWLLHSKTVLVDDLFLVDAKADLDISVDFNDFPEQLYVGVSVFDWRRKPYHAPITRQNMIELVKLWPFMEANNEELFLVFDGYTYTLYGDADKEHVMQLIKNDLILQLECVLLLAIEKKQNQTIDLLL